MNKFTFLVKTALLNIRRERLLTISKFFPSLFCMFFALLLIGSYEGGMKAFTRERCGFKEISELRMYVAEEQSELPRDPETAEHFIFYAQNDRVMFGEKYLAGVGISLTDKRFSELFESFCEKGRYISGAESECVIGSVVSEKYGIAVSNKISVGVREYTVCGITDNAGYQGSLLLCDPRELDAGCPRIFISASGLHGTGRKFAGERIGDYFGSVLNLSNIIPIFIMCGAMLIFSAVNVFNVTAVTVKKTTFKARVYRCLGASRGKLFTILLTENLCINILSFAAAFALLAALKKAVLVIFSAALEFSPAGIALVFILNMLLSFIYSFGTIRKDTLCSA